MRCLKFSLYLICFLLAGGCSTTHPPAGTTATQSTDSVVSKTTPTIVVSVLTSTSMPLPLTETPLPTLPSDDAYIRLQELVENNAGCRLPCWWGITPGKTSWQDASHFLGSFTTIYRDENSSYAYVYLPLPPDKGTLNHTYVVKGSTVVEIYAYVYDWSPFLYLSNFLTNYGPPDEVFLRTFRLDENGSQPYQIDLFYANLGMLLEYSGGNPNTIGDKIQNCFDDLYSPFIYIWTSDTPMTSAEAIDKYLDTENMPYPLPLDEATEMDVVTFYETFKKTDNTTCLETPSDLWP